MVEFRFALVSSFFSLKEDEISHCSDRLFVYFIYITLSVYSDEEEEEEQRNQQDDTSGDQFLPPPPRDKCSPRTCKNLTGECYQMGRLLLRLLTCTEIISDNLKYMIAEEDR
ncbi:hypothetical protein F2Q68_00035356 [Brassica cretica]|uniref:Uncharacterized protein n=1 Tax=Brassica cretica TaxID=69181 RepID=A0A8S9GY52_BRACR|nr:hypothetical protein F2Q68_00035356 [Brassica cretica]